MPTPARGGDDPSRILAGDRFRGEEASIPTPARGGDDPIRIVTGDWGGGIRWGGARGIGEGDRNNGTILFQSQKMAMCHPIQTVTNSGHPTS